MASALLSLIASLIWGSSDFAAGIMTRRTTLWAVVLFTQVGGFTTTGIIVLVLGRPFPSTEGWLIAMATGLLGICAIVSFYKALSIGVMSLVAPLSSTGIVVPVVVGLIQGDRPSLLQALGMALALAGILLASIEPTGHTAAGPPTSGFVADSGAPGTTPRVPARARLQAAVRSRMSIVLALFAALTIGMSYVGLAKAAQYGPYWTVFLMRATTLPLVLLTLLIARPRLGLSRTSIPIIFLAGAGDVIANTLFAVASRSALLAVVAVLGYLFPVVTVVLAHVFLHERLTRLQRAGAAAALAGALLMVA